MVLVDALYINKGGGAVLLQYLIQRIMATGRGNDFFFLLDPRFEQPAMLTANYVVVKNRMSERMKFYKQNKDRFSRVFCFANTPPPIRLKVPVYTYFHNQKLLAAPKHRFQKNYRSAYLKYLVVKLYNSNTDYYIVQTPHMVHELTALGLKDTAHCLTVPFYDSAMYRTGHPSFDDRLKDEFVFISNPSPQKNYPVLLDAWEHLLQAGHTPHLHVTIDHTAPQLLQRMQSLMDKGARITNHVYLDPRELYFSCAYLIFPSILESFGLPLIEAVDSGMKVLASDLPYVHDVIVPSLTFDPHSKVSIANAVLTALSTELPFPSLVTTDKVNELIRLLV